MESDGRSLAGRATHEPSQQAVSAVPVGIPNAADIPPGWYCYASIDDGDENGIFRIKGMCPYWERRPDEHAYCRFLDYHTESSRELLWDQVKICGVSDD